MLRKKIFILILIFPVVISGQNYTTKPLLNKSIISNFLRLESKQLHDTANYYYSNNITDTALVCFNLILNSPTKAKDLKQQERIVDAYNKSAIIYFYMSDYKRSYDYLIKALNLSEKYNFDSYIPLIYNNMGNIYARFNRNDIAKSYFLNALNLSHDSVESPYSTKHIGILNNLGHIELENGNFDSAFYFFDKSLHIGKQHNYEHLDIIMNSFASFYLKTHHHDSAFYYYRLSLEESKKNNKVVNATEVLCDLGKLFFEINKPDSALYYIDLSNTIAKENNLLRIMAENFLISSSIEEAKGNTKKAFEYYKKYVNLKDSVLNTEILDNINQLQRLYEVSKSNQQIEELIIEKQIQENKNYYKTIFWYITLAVLVFVCIVLVIIFLQKRKLNKAYKVLFDKNIEIRTLLNSEKNHEKYKKSSLTEKLQNELLNKILIEMQNVSTICDTEFTLKKLADLTGTNQAYISQIINSAFKKSFNSFLNGYRINEAQRLFAEPETKGYTIESVANRVGYKSRATFINAFKEITGVTPKFYLKSMKEDKSESDIN